jgi:hypothetical protein
MDSTPLGFGTSQEIARWQLEPQSNQMMDVHFTPDQMGGFKADPCFDQTIIFPDQEGVRDPNGIFTERVPRTADLREE